MSFAVTVQDLFVLFLLASLLARVLGRGFIALCDCAENIALCDCAENALLLHSLRQRCEQYQ
jgi:hypothetical protein